jgi:hypothetical protein
MSTVQSPTRNRADGSDEDGIEGVDMNPEDDAQARAWVPVRSMEPTSPANGVADAGQVSTTHPF